MKKASVIAFILMLCLLCSCTGAKQPAAEPDMQTVADAVTAAAKLNMEDMAQTPDNYVQELMNIAPDLYEIRNTLISSVGTSINEYGIFKATSKENADAIAEALKAYLDYRRSVWMDEYMPEEKPKLENAEVWQQGSYVMYAILDDSARSAAHSAFDGCFEG